MKGQLKYYIQEHMEEHKYLVNDLYEHPEIGSQELRSMRVLCKMLCKGGSEVTEEYVVPTGSPDAWDSGKSRPVIAYTYEYDALPEAEHGYGHNLIVGTLLTAGCALKSIPSGIGGEVCIIGTPAEENFGRKVSMATIHVFDDMNMALMLHPDTKNSLGGRTLAIYPLRFEFFGQDAHARTPQNGKGALDVTITGYMSINPLRQLAEPSIFIRGVVAHGEEATNVIPAYTSLEYYFRGKTMECVKKLCEKTKARVEGAHTVGGCTSRITTYECPYDDYAINYTLVDMLKDEYEDSSYPWEGVDEVAQGSSDVGSVNYCCPTLQGHIKITDSCVNGHSREMVATTIS